MKHLCKLFLVTFIASANLKAMAPKVECEKEGKAYTFTKEPPYGEYLWEQGGAYRGFSHERDFYIKSGDDPKQLIWCAGNDFKGYVPLSYLNLEKATRGQHKFRQRLKKTSQPENNYYYGVVIPFHKTWTESKQKKSRKELVLYSRCQSGPNTCDEVTKNSFKQFLEALKKAQ